MAQLDERFVAQVRMLRRRARRELVLARLVQGVFAGALAGAVLAALGGTIRLPIPAPLAAAAAAALGVAAGVFAGLLRGLDTRHLLINADRALQSRELLTTAWELARPSSPDGVPARAGIFTESIFEDAADLLADTPPRRMLGMLRLPLLPFIPVLAVLIAAASLFPFDVRSLFAPRRFDSREIAVLGEELEGLGRRIEAASRELDMGRGLELSRELAQLGRDLRDRTVEPDEILQRVEGLRRRIAEEQGLRLRRVPDGQGRQRVGGGEGENGSSAEEAGDAPKGEADPSADQKPGLEDGKSPPVDKDSQDLADAMRKLDQLEDRASRQRAAEADPSSLGHGGGGAAPGKSGPATGDDGAGEGGGRESPSPGQAEGTASSEPGSTPVPDRKRAPEEIARGDQGIPLKAESTAEGAGEAMKLLVRSLPSWSAAKIPEARVLRDYQRQAESALAHEEVPAQLRPYVKRYFDAIGMGARGD